MTDLEALVVAAYVVADEYPAPARCGRPPARSSDRQFLGLVEPGAAGLVPGWTLFRAAFSGRGKAIPARQAHRSTSD
jgi:hypothetical protein